SCSIGGRLAGRLHVLRGHLVLDLAQLVAIDLGLPGGFGGGLGRFGFGCVIGRRHLAERNTAGRAQHSGHQESVHLLISCLHAGRTFSTSSSTTSGWLRCAGILPASISLYQYSWCSRAQCSST